MDGGKPKEREKECKMTTSLLKNHYVFHKSIQ